MNYKKLLNALIFNAIIYLLFSFVALTFDVIEWHILWRAFYAIIFTIAIMIWTSND